MAQSKKDTESKFKSDALGYENNEVGFTVTN
jgi:hypothetical protein